MNEIIFDIEKGTNGFHLSQVGEFDLDTIKKMKSDIIADHKKALVHDEVKSILDNRLCELINHTHSSNHCDYCKIELELRLLWGRFI